MYSMMREFADSWALLGLVLVFLGIVVWAWRPGSRKGHDNAADIPFRHDEKPSPEASSKDERP